MPGTILRSHDNDLMAKEQLKAGEVEVATSHRAAVEAAVTPDGE